MIPQRQDLIDLVEISIAAGCTGNPKLINLVSAHAGQVLGQLPEVITAPSTKMTLDEVEKNYVRG